MCSGVTFFDAVVKPRAGKGQRSTAPRGSRGGSAKAKASIRSKPRPRKRHKVRPEVTGQLKRKKEKEEKYIAIRRVDGSLCTQ